MAVECPLCCQHFSESNIAEHASTCGLTRSDNGDNGEATSKKRKLDGNQVDETGASPANKKIASMFSNKKAKTDEKASNGNSHGNHSLKDEKPSNKIIAPPSQSKDEPKPNIRKPNLQIPLAERMRPSDFDVYLGQEGAIGPGSQLRKLLEADHVPSLILWGPPGCGKTSLVNVIGKRVKSAKLVKMSAVTAGVADVREIIKQAKNDVAMFKRRTILFLDEVHRFNKAQQDSFLPHIESGTITFIGATTENPSFSLNAALLSRCRVVTLEKLDPAAVRAILERALKEEDVGVGEGDGVFIKEDALDYLSTVVDGDARTALNNLQLVVEGSRTDGKNISVEDVKEAARRSHVLYDRSGDQHYHMASALQKSIRGSNDNAALYWVTRMLAGGEDPAFIARRLVRTASEDIGLGDPTALPLAVAAFQGSQLIGKPECDVLLCQAAVHLARAKKNPEVYMAMKAAQATIQEGSLPSVPLHLRNATSKLTRELGWGKGYSHDTKVINSLEYMPKELKGVNFFSKQL